MNTWQNQWDANERALAAHDAEVEAFCETRANARAAFKVKHGNKVPFPSKLAGDGWPRRLYAQQSRLVDRQTSLVARYGQGESS